MPYVLCFALCTVLCLMYYAMPYVLCYALCTMLCLMHYAMPYALCYALCTMLCLMYHPMPYVLMICLMYNAMRFSLSFSILGLKVDDAVRSTIAAVRSDTDETAWSVSHKLLLSYLCCGEGLHVPSYKFLFFLSPICY